MSETQSTKEYDEHEKKYRLWTNYNKILLTNIRSVDYDNNKPSTILHFLSNEAENRDVWLRALRMCNEITNSGEKPHYYKRVIEQNNPYTNEETLLIQLRQMVLQTISSYTVAKYDYSSSDKNSDINEAIGFYSGIVEGTSYSENDKKSTTLYNGKNISHFDGKLYSEISHLKKQITTEQFIFSNTYKQCLLFCFICFIKEFSNPNNFIERGVLNSKQKMLQLSAEETIQLFIAFYHYDSNYIEFDDETRMEYDNFLSHKLKNPKEVLSEIFSSQLFQELIYKDNISSTFGVSYDPYMFILSKLGIYPMRKEDLFSDKKGKRFFELTTSYKKRKIKYFVLNLLEKIYSLICYIDLDYFPYEGYFPAVYEDLIHKNLLTPLQLLNKYDLIHFDITDIKMKKCIYFILDKIKHNIQNQPKKRDIDKVFESKLPWDDLQIVYEDYFRSLLPKKKLFSEFEELTKDNEEDLSKLTKKELADKLVQKALNNTKQK